MNDNLIETLMQDPTSAEVLDRAIEAIAASPDTAGLVETIEGLARESNQPLHLIVLSEALHRVGRFDDALEALRDGHSDLEITVCDFSPKWHAQTGKLLGTGQTVVYENNKVRRVRPRATSYAVYDPDDNRWSPWQSVELPDEPKFKNGKILAFADVDLADGVTVRGFRVVNGDNGLFAAVPSKPISVDGQTRYMNQVVFAESDKREEFLANLLKAYERWEQERPASQEAS